MGESIIYLLVIYAVYLDAKNLRAENEKLYEETVSAHPWLWAILALLFFIFVSPIYLLRRRNFIKNLPIANATNAEPSYKNPNLLTVTEFTGLIITWSFLGNLTLLSFELLEFKIKLFQDKIFFSVVGGLIIDCILVALIYRAVNKYRQGGFWYNINFRKVTKPILHGVLLPVILGATFACLAFITSKDATPVSSPLRTLLSKGSGLSLLLFIGSAILIAPFFEEIFFRGYLYSFISKIKSQLYTIIFVAALFAIAHVDQLWGDWLSLLTVFLMGLSITYLRARSGSIIPAMSAHYAYNMSLVVIPLIYFFTANPAYMQLMLQRDSLDKAKQEQLLIQCIQKDKKFSEAYNELAWLYAEQNKNLGEALGLIETALKAKPDNSAYLDTKAEILYKLGRYDEAIEIESRLAKKEPADPFYKKQLKKYKDAKMRVLKPGSGKLKQ